MKYNKGEQFTAGKLKKYLSCVPDDVRLCCGFGDNIAPLRYLFENNGELVFHSDLYGVDAESNNVETLLKLLNQ